MYQKLNHTKTKSAETTSLAYKYLPAMKLMFRYLVVLTTLSLLLILGYKHVLLRKIENSDLEFDNNLKLMNNLAEEVVTKKQSLINLNELNHIGECLIKEAGKLIVKLRKEHNDQLNLNRKQKDNSIVTKADLLSHQIIVHSLNYKYKNLRVVSEENNSQTGNESFDPIVYLNKCDTYKPNNNVDNFAQLKDVKVFIDPLDATQEYSENLIEYVTVMFCMVIKGKPKAGIIHNPFLNETVSSFLENKTIDNSAKPPKNTRIIVSRSHTGTAKSIIEKRLKDAKLIIAGGSGYKTLKVLKGDADLYLHTSKIYKWDICAPNAILSNKGGDLRERSGASAIDYLSTSLETVPVQTGIVASIYNHDYYMKIFRTF